MNIKTKTQGTIINTYDQQRKTELAKKLEASYTSLPNVVCDDFFNRYTRCLFAKLNPTFDNNNQNYSKPRDKIHIHCKISQTSKGSINNNKHGYGKVIINKKLTQVDEEDEYSDDVEEIVIKKCDRRNNKINKHNDYDDGYDYHDDYETNNDFRLFLNKQAGVNPNSTSSYQSQTASSSSSNHYGQESKKRSQLKIYQNSSWKRRGEKLSKNSDGDGDKNDKKAKQPAGNDNPKCYELFCIHQASLLVHRQQVFVEAEKLAYRLGKLLEDRD